MPSESYGPLSLQVGPMTHGIEDLIIGYEKLIDTIPIVAEKTLAMSKDIQIMQQESAEKLRQTVESYQYLSGMATQIPSLYETAAETYRNSLHDKVGNEQSLENKENMENQSKRLDAIRVEMMSMAHERVIIDVLTRDIVSESKRKLNRTSSVGRSTNLYTAQSKVKTPPAKPSSDLNALIDIPSFVPSSSVGAAHQSSVKPPQQAQKPPMPAVYTRGARNAEVVPNSCSDSLANVLQGVVPTAGDGLIHNTDKKYKRRSSKNTFEPLAKKLVKNYSQAERGLADMQAQLDAVKKKLANSNKNKSKSTTPPTTTQESNHSLQDRDYALLNSVGRVIKDAVDSFQSAVHDSEAFRLLQSLADAELRPQQDRREQQYQDRYKVITVGAGRKPAASPVPTPPPVAAERVQPPVPSTRPTVAPSDRVVHILVKGDADSHVHWEPTVQQPDADLAEVHWTNQRDLRAIDPQQKQPPYSAYVPVPLDSDQFDHNTISPTALRSNYHFVRRASTLHDRNSHLALQPLCTDPPPPMNAHHAQLFPTSVSPGVTTVSVDAKQLIVYQAEPAGDGSGGRIPPPDGDEPLHFPFREVLEVPTTPHHNLITNQLLDAPTHHQGTVTTIYPPLTSMTQYPMQNTQFDHHDALFDRLHRDGPYWLSRVALIHEKTAEPLPEKEKVEEPPQAPAAAPGGFVTQTIYVQPAAASGVEKELVHLLHSVVETQQAAMQGNQALMLSLIQQQSGGQCRSCAEGTGDEITATVEEVSHAGESEQQIAVSPKAKGPRNEYNTALGEVLMEGELLHGPYTIVPKPHSKFVSGSKGVRTAVTIDEEDVQHGPRLRVIASDELMQQLRQPVPTAPKAIPAVVQEALSDEPVMSLLRTLAGTGGASEPATRDFISQAVRSGVEQGVKEALGFLDTAGVSAGQMERDGRDAKRLHKTQSRHCPLYKEAPQYEENDSCPPGFLKIGKRPLVKTKVDFSEGEAKRHPIQSKHQPRFEDEVQREAAISRRHAEELVDRDICCSFDDSLSLDEETAAFLGDNKIASRGQIFAHVGQSLDSNCSDQTGSTSQPIKTLYRSKLTRDCVELFDQETKSRAARTVRHHYSAEPRESDPDENWYESPEEADLPRTLSAHYRGNPDCHNGQFRPLLSKVLQQSATEDMFGRPELALFCRKVAQADDTNDADETHENISVSDCDSSLEGLHKPKLHSAAKASLGNQDKHSESALNNVKNVVAGGSVDHSEDLSHSLSQDSDSIPAIPVAKLRIRGYGEHSSGRFPALSEVVTTGYTPKSNEVVVSGCYDVTEAEEVQDRDEFVAEMAKRHTLFSAAGVEQQNPMFASNQLDRPGPGQVRGGLEKEARRVNRESNFRCNQDKLLVDPHQVIAIHKDHRSAPPTAAHRPLVAKMTHSASFSASSLDLRVSRLSDGSSSRSSSSTSTWSSASSNSSRSAVVKSATASKQPQRENLADHMMMDLLTRQRSVNRNQGRLVKEVVCGGRASNAIDRYAKHQQSAARESLSEDDHSAQDDSLLDMSIQSGSSQSSVAEYVKPPSKLLTVGLKQGGSSGNRTSVSGAKMQWR